MTDDSTSEVDADGGIHLAAERPGSPPLREAAPRILVADDNEEMRSALSLILGSMGTIVEEADNGLDIVTRLVDGGPYDLLVADVRMPWMTGLQAAIGLRHAGLGIPIILISAFGDERLQGSIDALGDVVFLHKPFTREAIVNATRRALHLDD